MNRSFQAELLKLRRPAVLLGAGLVAPLLAVLSTVAGFASASDAVAGPRTGPVPAFSLDGLAGAGGLTAGFAGTSTFLGVLFFVLFLTSTAGEHTNGTLRVLLVQQPRRLQLMGGKLLALVVFSAAALLVALLAAGAASYAMAAIRGVDTSAWLSSDGLTRTAGDCGNSIFSAALFGVAGTALAAVVRSQSLALAAGLAWLLPLEHIVQNSWSGAGRWFPGLLFAAVSTGGSDTTSYARALLLGGGVAVAALVASAGLFVRRDVST